MISGLVSYGSETIAVCVQIHIFMCIKPHFLNKIFLLEKKAVIYEKALDSLMVFSVWILSFLLFHPSQEGPAGPAASSKWEENKLGWCLPQAVCAWVAEAARSEVQVQLGPRGETPSQEQQKRKINTTLLFLEVVFSWDHMYQWDFGFPCDCDWKENGTCVMWWTW